MDSESVRLDSGDSLEAATISLGISDWLDRKSSSLGILEPDWLDKTYSKLEIVIGQWGDSAMLDSGDTLGASTIPLEISESG